MKKCLALLLFALPLIGCTVVAAQDSGTPSDKVIAISPAATKPTVKPGQSIKDKLQVINQGSAAYTVEVYAAPYSVDGEEYTPEFDPVAGKPDVTSWISFDKTNLTVPKNKTVDVNYTLAVPENTEPGGYYLVAFVESKSDEEGQGVIVNQRLGEVFYINVPGNVKESGKVLTWEADFLQKSPMTATLRLENDGGTHYGSNTKLQVKDLFGGTKYEQVTDKQVLPQTIRHIPFEWKEAPPLGLFKVTGSTHIPSGDVQLSTQYVLVISPFTRIVFLILIGIVIAFGAFKVVHRKSNRRARDRG